jgi:hypothetical protein
MLVSDFKKNAPEDIIDGFLELLPETCIEPRCNAPMQISEALTDLHCSNPRCPVKVKMRMVAMLQSIGVKGVGESTASAILDNFKIDNPLLIWGYVPDEDGAIADGMSMETSRKIYDQLQAKKSYTLWEYVRLAQLPNIQTSALLIFGDYDSLEKAYEDIEKGGVDFIASKLNIKKGTDSEGDQPLSIRALKVLETLTLFKKDLFNGLEYIDIIKKNDGSIISLKAVCSDEVGDPFRTKADFYGTVNNRFKDNIHVDFLSSVTKSIDYLIWAGADGSPARVTNKVKKVTAWNEQYKNGGKQDHEIPILTATQFIAKLESIVDGNGE